MGTFAETANVDYPRKTNFRYPFPFAANKRRFFFSVFRLQQTNGSYRFLLALFSEFRKHGDMETWRNGDMKFKKEQTENGTRWFSLISFLFAHRANGSSSFVEEETKRSYPFANGPN
jgi:hypothetical protein